MNAVQTFYLELGNLNILALAVLLLFWLGYPLLTRFLSAKDLTEEVADFRHQWMGEMLHREERITDVSLVRGLASSVTFFASTTVLLISGLIGLLGSAPSFHASLESSNIVSTSSLYLFEVKILTLLVIFIHSFFKFGWSMRLHTYSSILIGAAPQTELMDSDEARTITRKAADISALASHHYFAGMRGYYFAIAGLGWFVSPVALLAATIFIFLVLLRREHFSRALAILQS